MFDSFLLMPTVRRSSTRGTPSSAADMMRFGGANQDLLWLGFARRGFGQNATTAERDDTEPRPDFESPRADEAT